MFLFLVSLMSVFSFAVGEENDLSALKAYGYDKAYMNISSRMNQPVGIVIIAFNRPHYLEKLVKSIENNLESQTLPFYFVLDGGPRAKQKENREVIERSSIKYKEVILRPRNFGCAKTVIDAHRFMFDWCGFQKIIYIQEDLVLSPYYFKLLLNLHKWATSNYSNVGMVSGWSYCNLNKDKKKERLALVKEPMYWWSFVTYCLDSNVWNDIKPILYDYEKFIDMIPHSPEFDKARSKPGFWKDASKVRSWMRTLCSMKAQSDSHFPLFHYRIEPGKAIFPSFGTYKTIRDYYYLVGRPFSINEDCMTAFSLWMKGYLKIETVVNRLKHIGEIGITGAHNISLRPSLDIFHEDKELQDFIILFNANSLKVSSLLAH